MARGKYHFLQDGYIEMRSLYDEYVASIVSDKRRAALDPGWNLMRSSLMEAFGSRRVSLK